MKFEVKKLLPIIKNLNGNVLIIGNLDEKLKKELEKNQKITTCNCMSSITKGKKIRGKEKGTTLNIKKIRKKFHKKKVDYIICNIEEINCYFKTFIKDSVYINKQKIYFYGEKNKYELKNVKKRYQQYGAEIEEEQFGNRFLLTIHNEKSKTNKFKDIWYFICDSIIWLYEMIGDILIN